MGRRPEVWIAVYLQFSPEDMSQLRDVVSLAWSLATALLPSAPSNTEKVHSLDRSSLVSSPLRSSHLPVIVRTLNHILH